MACERGCTRTKPCDVDKNGDKAPPETGLYTRFIGPGSPILEPTLCEPVGYGQPLAKSLMNREISKKLVSPSPL